MKYLRNNGNKEKIVKFLCVIVSIGLMIFILNKVSFPELLYSIKSVNSSYLISASMLFLLINFLLAPIKWKHFMRIFGVKMNFKESISLKLSITPLKFALPFKSVEVFRAAYFKTIHGLSLSACGKYIIFDILGSLATVCIIVALHFSVVKFQLYGILLIILVLTVLYFSLLSFINLIDKTTIFQSVATRALDLLLIIFISLLTVMLEIISVQLLFKSLNINIKLISLLLFVPLIILITNAPITYNGIGSRELAMIYFFGAHGTNEQLITISVLYFAIEQIFPAIIGLPFLNTFFNKIGQAQIQTSLTVK